VKRFAVCLPAGVDVYTLPMKCLIRVLFVVLLAAPSLPCGAAVATLPPGAVLVESAPPASTAQAAAALQQSVQSALRQQRPQAAIALLAAEADPLLFEWAADAVIAQLRSAVPDAAGGVLLDWLAGQPVRVYRRHEETAADWFVPLFDVGARARGSQMLWRQHEQRLAWQQRLAQQPKAALRALATADAAQQARAAEALPALLPGERAALRAALSAAAPVALWHALALLQPDAEAYAQVLARGSQTQQLELIASAPQALPAAEAQRWLETAGESPELASAALLALAALAPRHPPALERLKSALDDPLHGASAAAAWARLPQPDRVQRIEALLGMAPSATRAAHLVLALRLDGSPQAQAVLRRWSGDQRLPEALRRELQR
jgi:hypothetical protein